MLKRIAAVLFLLLTASCQDQLPSVTDPALSPGGPAMDADCNDDFHSFGNCHSGSHIRYGNVRWRAVGPNTAEFTYDIGIRGTPAVGTAVGTQAVLHFGDGTAMNPQFTVTYVDPANNWYMARAVVTHTYPGAGPYTALSNGCCRIGPISPPFAHVNNPNGSFRFATLVNFASSGSAVSGLPAIVACPKNGTCQFQVAATAPAGQTIRWRMANSSEMVGNQPVSASGSPTINPNTGEYVWNTSGAALGSSAYRPLYSTQVVMETIEDGAVTSASALDFFIELADIAANAPPAFVSPTPADGSELQVAPGGTVSFTVAASDQDASDRVTLGAIGLPTGAGFVPPAAGNPVSTTFTWSPPAADEDQSHVVNFVATDSRGGSASPRSVVIRVLGNQAPVASTGGPYSTTEGVPVTVTASGTDADGDALSYAWDTDGDGQFDDATEASINLTFADNRADGSAHEVTVRVSDSRGASAVTTTEVEVDNSLPVVDAGDDLAGNPGVAVSLAASFTDAGRLDKPWKYTVNWGDGTAPETGTVDAYAERMTISGSHTYARADEYTVVVSVEDKDRGGTGMDQLTVDVANRAPTAAAGGPYSGSEGASIEFDGTGSDPDGDAVAFAWDFDGDGTTDATTARASFAFPDDGTFEAALTVTDEHGATSTATATAIVANLAPSATFGDDGPVGEGSEFVLSLSDATDRGEDDRATLKFAFDCGSGYGDASGRSSARCPTDDDGSRDVRAKVIDDDGGATEYTGTVTVHNLVPTGTFTHDGPVDEGSSFRLSMDATDPSPRDVAAGLTFAFDCGTGIAGFGASSSAGCATTDDGTRNVTGKVLDKDGGLSSYTASVSVRNVAPEVEAGADAEVTSGGSFDLRGSFTDPGADSPWRYSVGWGDGTPSTGSASAPGTVSESYRYLAAGTYTVSLSVSDKDGASGRDELTVTVKRLRVAVDVRPGSTENPVNLKARGELPVVVLSEPGFDARQVDVASVRFGPAGATETHGRAHHEDVDGDGDVDLVLHFDTQAIGLTQASTDVSLVADLIDGRQIEGSDAVQVK